MCFFCCKADCKAKKGGRAQHLDFVFSLSFIFVRGSTSEAAVDDNIYKIDDSVIAVADMIEEHKEMENPVVLCDAELYYWIRQYNPAVTNAVTNSVMDIYRFKAADEIDTTEQYESKKKALSMFTRGVEIDVETANELLKKKKVDYFVRNTDYYSDFYLEHLNLEYVDAVDGYELYRCIHD